MSRWLIVALGPALLAGCTWVKLTEGGARVKQATAEEVASCTRVGSTNATTNNRGGISWSARKVQEELIVLAANQAAAIGGNAMVPEGLPSNGSQTFIVYRCDG